MKQKSLVRGLAILAVFGLVFSALLPVLNAL